MQNHLTLSAREHALFYATPQDAARFWAKAARDNSTGCLEWTGYCNSRGYGAFRLAGVTVSAHRLAYVLAHADIRHDLAVCHTCDNPRCVEPDHLFLGTQKDNMSDCSTKGRTARVNPKLTPSQVKAMRTKRAAGATYMSLAQEYGVAYSTARNAITGIRWAGIR